MMKSSSPSPEVFSSSSPPSSTAIPRASVSSISTASNLVSSPPPSLSKSASSIFPPGTNPLTSDSSMVLSALRSEVSKDKVVLTDDDDSTLPEDKTVLSLLAAVTFPLPLLPPFFFLIVANSQDGPSRGFSSHNLSRKESLGSAGKLLMLKTFLPSTSLVSSS